MSEEILYIRANIDDLEDKLDGVERSFNNTEKAGKQTGESITRSFEKSTKALKDAQSESDRLAKIIREQEKITADFRIELARLGEAFKKAGGDGTLAGQRIGKEMSQLKGAITDNVQSIKKLKIDKTQADQTVSSLKKTTTELERQTKKVDPLTKAFNNLGARIIAVFAISKIKDFAVDMAELASSIQQFDQKAEIVFGESLPSIEREAKKAAIAIGLTKREFVSAAAGIADILVPLGFSRDRSAELAAETTKLAGAISNWSAGQYDATEASQILQKALVGETEQLKAVGIIVDQSSKAYRDRIDVLMRTEGLTLQQAKALEALRQITEQSSDAQTGFANGAESIALKQAKANAQVREAKEAFAEMITPAILAITEQYADTIESITDRLVGLAEQGLSGFFDREVGENIRNVRSEVDDLTDSFLASIEDFDPANVKQYYSAYADALVEASRTSVSFGELSAEQREKELTDALFAFEDIILAEAKVRASRKETAKVSEDAAQVNEKASAKEVQAQLGLIESLRERVKLLNEVAEKAQDQEAITAALNEREEVEERINKILNDRNKIDLQIPDNSEFFESEGARLDAVRETNKAINEAGDQAYEEALQAKLDKDQKEREIDKNTADYKRELTQLQQQAQLDASLFLFGQLKTLYADDAEAQKQFAVAETVISTLQAATRALEAGPIAGPIFAALIAAIGFANVAKIQSTQIPSYFEGTEYVKLGKNRKGKDTIPAMLNEGEAVIPSNFNKQNEGLAKAWISGGLEKYIAIKYVVPAIKQIKDREVHKYTVSVPNQINASLSDKRIVDELKKNRKTNELLIDALSRNYASNPYRR